VTRCSRPGPGADLLGVGPVGPEDRGGAAGCRDGAEAAVEARGALGGVGRDPLERMEGQGDTLKLGGVEVLGLPFKTRILPHESVTHLRSVPALPPRGTM
jgi:hypothetical protein